MEHKMSRFKKYIASKSFDSLYNKYMWLKFMLSGIITVLNFLFTIVIILYSFQSQLTHQAFVYIILSLLALYSILLIVQAIAIMNTSKKKTVRPSIDLVRTSSVQVMKFFLRLVKILIPILILGTSDLSNSALYIVSRIWAYMMLVTSIYSITLSLLNYFFNHYHKKFYYENRFEKNDQYEYLKEIYDKYLSS